jgi:hypothetical protein
MPSRPALGLLVFAQLFTQPNFVHAQDNTVALEPNSIVEDMLRKLPGNSDSVVALKGYVGPVSYDTVRLYANLLLARWWDIPRKDVLSSVPSGDPKTEPVTLYVRSSAIVTTSVRHSAGSAAAHSQAAMSMRAQALALPDGAAQPRAPGFCFSECLDCAAGCAYCCVECYVCGSVLSP